MQFELYFVSLKPLYWVLVDEVEDARHYLFFGVSFEICGKHISYHDLKIVQFKVQHSAAAIAMRMLWRGDSTPEFIVGISEVSISNKSCFVPAIVFNIEN